MELRQLRYFVAVAEELSFTRAAERIPVAVGALSVQIRRLETELHAPLFLRTTHSVELTAAGTTLLRIARKVLAEVDGAAEEIRRAAGARRLVVAVVDEGLAELTAPLLQAYRDAHPNVELALRPLHRRELLDPNVAVDVAMWVHQEPPTPAWRFEPIVTSDAVVVVSASHQLAGETTLRAADVVDETFLRVPEVARLWHRRHYLDDHRGGPPTRLGDSEVSDVAAGQTIMALSDAVIVQPATKLRYIARPDVRGIPLEDVAPFPLGIAWRLGDERPEIVDLVAMAHEIAATHDLPADVHPVG